METEADCVTGEADHGPVIHLEGVLSMQVQRKGNAQDKDLHSINILEYKAILQGIRLVVSHGLSRVLIESDSSTVVAWILGKGRVPWKAFQVHYELWSILASLDAWKASHTYREGNQVADHLAAWRNSLGQTTIGPHEAWQEPQQLLTQDVVGTKYSQVRK
ncbi:hypothetical protein QJS04_geneDACA008288 [Acorus gramineus]|uniref:RNase H type-1 domain-containing protein n=1 Tax=Acorus gramineus TaxID=55184 RepID=A0AAV9AZL8_ACOGR|nr:hypothetical protein QJS04_geneDACA008288 [Acorus gramineus]